MAWAPDYVSNEELSAYLRIDDLEDDAQVGLAISAASRAVDQDTNRQFGAVDAPEERFYFARPDYESGYWVLDVDDFQAVTGLAVVVDETAVTAFDKEPINAAAKGHPWHRIAFTADSEAQPCSTSRVSVTALWGWTAVPDTVKQATLLQASRFFTRRNAPFGIAGSPEMGSEMRLLAKVDPDVAVMLRAYRRTRAVG